MDAPSKPSSKKRDRSVESIRYPRTGNGGPMHGQMKTSKQLKQRYPAIPNESEWPKGEWCPGKLYYLGRCIDCGLIGRAQRASFGTIPYGTKYSAANVFRCNRCIDARVDAKAQRRREMEALEVEGLRIRNEMLTKAVAENQPSSWVKLSYAKAVALKRRHRLKELEMRT